MNPARVGRNERSELRVRPRRRTTRTVQVRAAVSHDGVAKRYCVTARWGGEQREANEWSAG